MVSNFTVHRDRADSGLVAQHRHDQDAAIARCSLQFAVSLRLRATISQLP
jgi:hypothetical protein